MTRLAPSGIREMPDRPGPTARRRALAAAIGLLLASACGASQSAHEESGPNQVETSSSAVDSAARDEATVRGDSADDTPTEMSSADFALRAVQYCTDSASAPADAIAYPAAGQACVLGERLAGREVLDASSADAEVLQDDRWVVNVDLAVPAGEERFNEIASICFNRQSPCESQQLAMVVGDIIVSAPVMQAPSFSGTLQISGIFTEAEALDLARMLRRAGV